MTKLQEYIGLIVSYGIERDFVVRVKKEGDGDVEVRFERVNHDAFSVRRSERTVTAFEVERIGVSAEDLARAKGEAMRAEIEDDVAEARS